MALRFAPLLPVWVVALGALFAALLIAYFYGRQWPLLARPTWWLLLVVKVLAVGLLFLALLGPYQVERQPDPNRLRVAVLVDATGSMGQRDCDGHSRQEVVNTQVLDPASPFMVNLTRRYPNHRLYRFAGDELRRLEPGAPAAILPGHTDIAGALRHLWTLGAADEELGAVLVISDGNHNAGQPLLDGAEPYRRAGVPVHTLGVGDPRARPDLAVRFSQVPAQATRGRPFTVAAEVTRNVTGAAHTLVTLTEGGREVATQDLAWAPDEQRHELTFERTSLAAGFATLRVRAAALPDEQNLLNNSDFAGLTIKDPDEFNVLYVAANLDWNYEFLARLSAEQERLHLHTIIRLGPQAWLARGFPADEKVNGLPAARDLAGYDCLILQMAMLSQLNAEQQQAVAQFVERRGGGLILLGVGDVPPADLQKLLPLKSWPTDLLVTRPEPLQWRSTRLLGSERPGDLPPWAARLKVTGETPAYPLQAEQLKPGALTVAVARDSGWLALVLQQYGAGKVAYLNLGDTWKWVLASDQGADDYGWFWGKLVAWMASSAKERLTIRPAGSRVAVNEPQEVAVDALDAQYAPASQAQVSATLTRPDGQEETLSFWPDPRVDGRFVAKFVPPASGEYRLAVRAGLPGSEPLQGTADYVAVNLDEELQPAPLAAGPLQALARLTGGRYWHYRDLASVRELPLAPRVHQIVTRRPWLDEGLFALALLLLVLPDWYLRRQSGLR